VVLQSRSLSADLEEAARQRLAGAAVAADRLLESHLGGLLERYHSVSETPELRANLEVGHQPTLQYFARRLAEREGASAVVFLDADGWPAAVGGDPDLAAAMLEDRQASRHTDSSLALDYRARVFAVAEVRIQTAGGPVGWLLAAHPIADETLALWSDLSGADVAFVPIPDAPVGRLDRAARTVGDLELRVSSTLEAERSALDRARRELLTGGAFALALAFGLSLLVSRGLVRPIRRIQDATGPIGRGELGVRLPVGRDDEIGDVSRAFNLMLERLEDTLSALRRSRSRLANAQHLARIGSWSLDPETGEIQTSDELRRILALRPGDGPVPQHEILARVHPADRARLREALRCCTQEATPFRLDQRSVPLNGAERFLHWRAEVVLSEGAPRVEGTVQDITERKLVEEQVRYLANHDALTGLGNRRVFCELLQASIQSARAQGSFVGVLLVDLDEFKLVNDTFGHSEGDRLLRSVAQQLVDGVRAIAPRARFDDEIAPSIARLGGDEFGILLPRIERPEDAGRAAQYLLRRISQPIELDGHELVVSGSVGIATWPADGDDFETLLRNCDTAMYHAKSRGRNNYQFYAEAMNAVVLKRLLLENKLRQAIECEELELEFQPKVELSSGRVRGFEALARWRDPEFGVVSPSDFIPLAEEAGLIDAIGDWVMGAGIEHLRRWSEDEDLAELRLAVNLSNRQLEDAGLPARIAGLLEEAGVDARCLDLEITETALMSGDPAVAEGLERLRALGAGISLDDFGTGYSSLSHLRRLPIDVLKIDRSFVTQVETDADDAALLGAIVSMAKVMRLRVVAEGVETEGQLSVLRELGCDEIQGNLMSPPVVVADVARVKCEIETAMRKQRARRGSRGSR
jgi:diguanylate cyclase (GGDEF)-like protein